MVRQQGSTKRPLSHPSAIAEREPEDDRLGWRPYSQLNTIAVKSQADGNWNQTERWFVAGLLDIELRPELSAPASGFAAL
jgi:hypothetical protein